MAIETKDFYSALPDGMEAYGVLNLIRNSSSELYRERVPEATKNNLAEVGKGIMELTATSNEFITVLLERIGMVVIENYSFTNPLSRFKKGNFTNGNYLQDIWVDVVKAKKFDQQKAETEVWKREIPDVKVMYHEINRKEYYKQTVTYEQVSTAFTSYGNLNNFFVQVINQMYTSNQVDEFLYMKQLFGEFIESAKLQPSQIIKVPKLDTKEASEQLTKAIKIASNGMVYPSRAYNELKVLTHASKEDQLLFLDSTSDAILDVDVLANAFNMNKVDWLGNKTMLDNFGDGEKAKNVVAVLTDKRFFEVRDKYAKMEVIRNPEGLYWNYNFHVWQMISASKFANFIVFTTGEDLP